MRACFILTSLLRQSLVCRGPSKSSILYFNPKALPLENSWLWEHPAYGSTQWPAWPLRPGGCTGLLACRWGGPLSRARVLGSGGESDGRSLLGEGLPKDKCGLGDTTPSNCLTKAQDSLRAWGGGEGRVKQGFGFELGAVEENICFMERVLQKTTLRQLYPTSLPQIDFIFLICGEKILKWCEHVSRGANVKSWLEQHFALELCS